MMPPPESPETPPAGGFEVHVTLEQIREFRQLSTEEKLTWLSKAQRFVWALSSPEAKRFQERFRRGQL